jgi:hypothetical protein
MSRRLCVAALALGLASLAACWLSSRSDPDAPARRAFRRNLAAASPNWGSVELECTSPGCANHVQASWTEAGVKYVFTGFRNPKSMGGGVVMVYGATSYRDGTGPSLITYCFMSDGSPTKVTVDQGAEAYLAWTGPRARELFDAVPAND